MYSKLLSTAAVVLATSGLVSAQTSSACDPVKGQGKFMPACRDR